jgi:hypothetical protein
MADMKIVHMEQLAISFRKFERWKCPGRVPRSWKMAEEGETGDAEYLNEVISVLNIRKTLVSLNW